jgi:hypothetical protein
MLSTMTMPGHAGARPRSAATTSAKLDPSSPIYRSLVKKMQALAMTPDQWSTVRDDELFSGHPFPYLTMLRHVLDPKGPCPCAVAEAFRAHAWFVLERDDSRFVHNVFRLLREDYQLQPALKEAQFLKHDQFASDKATFVAEVATLVRRREAALAARLAAAMTPNHHAVGTTSSALRAIAAAPGTAATSSSGALALISAGSANASRNKVATPRCCGEGAAGEQVHRGAFQRQQHLKVQAERDTLDYLRAQHRVLSRVPRAEPRFSRGNDAAAQPTACWYCVRERAAAEQDQPCKLCGAAPPRRLMRSPLNADSLSAHNSSNSSSSSI